MGKGDIRSRRGKVWRGTYGVTRPQRWKSAAARPAATTRKVKALKDLPKAVAEPVVKKPVVETVIKPQVAETIAPVVEKVQPVAANAVVETPKAAEVPVVRETKVEAKAPAKKAPAAKKPAAKKAPAAKKPAAKKKK